MQPTPRSAHDPGSESRDALRAAFRELHGRRLHGFALLLGLGDRARAAQLTADALSEGALRLEELRHPERAAAWLRARLVRVAPGMRLAEGRPGERLQTLAELGVDRAMLAGLAALEQNERAALIASSIERLDRRDVALVVARDGERLDRLLERTRRRYALAYAAAVTELPPAGPLSDRVHEVARLALA